MEKQFKHWSALLLILIVSSFCCVLASCGDDDEPSNGNDSGSSNNVLVGTWTMQYDNGLGSISWTFNSNGTGKISSTIDMDYGAANGSFNYSVSYYDSSSKQGSFNYTFTSGKSKGQSYSQSFKINGNSITIEGWTYYK